MTFSGRPPTRRIPGGVRRRRRQRLLREALASAPEGWVLSGWLGGWGDVFVPEFQAALFLTVPPAQRLDRLQRRESERFGVALLPGGERHAAHQDFLAWAAGYDSDTSSRSRAQQQAWLAALACPLLQLDNAGAFEHTLTAALTWLDAL